jgi:hypothetical protein
MVFVQRSQAGAGSGLGLRRGGISKVGEMKPKKNFAMVVQRIAGRCAVKVLARLRCVCVVAGGSRIRKLMTLVVETAIHEYRAVDLLIFSRKFTTKIFIPLFFGHD